LPPAACCLLQEAKSIGDEFLQLEKYVNLNYMGFHKILVGGGGPSWWWPLLSFPFDCLFLSFVCPL
jgi:hypothetical protein